MYQSWWSPSIELEADDERSCDVWKNSDELRWGRHSSRVSKSKRPNRSNSQSTALATNVFSSQVSHSLINRHNVAPTYNQPVIRQVGERNDRAQDASAAANSTIADADTDNNTTVPPTSPKSSFSTAKRGDLIVQSMRYSLF